MPTFDGDNLVMTLDATASQDVINDWYEPWKDWMLASPLNRKYPQLFLSEGGSPVDATKTQAPYVRVNNDAGWRIRPPEQNIEITYTGNLVRTNNSLPIFISTVGSYSTQVFNVQSIAQTVENSVNVVTGTALTAQETADAVWDEAISGHGGVGSTGEALDNASTFDSTTDQVIVATNNDKTGYALSASGDSSIASATRTELSTELGEVSDTNSRVIDIGLDVTDIHDEALGKWEIDHVANTLKLYRVNGALLKTFALTSTTDSVPNYITRTPA